MNAPRFLTVLIVLVLAGVGAGSALADGSAVRILARDNSVVEFEYVPGPGRPVSTTDSRGEANHLEFDDVLTTDDPGLPIVPLHTERMIVPEGAAFHVEFSVERATTLRGLRFPTWPLPAVPDERGASARDTAPVVDQDRLYPEARVSWSLEEFRGQRILLVTLAPLQFNPAAGTTQLAGAIHVRVTFSGGSRVSAPATPAEASLRESAADPLLSGLVLNPDAASPVHPSITRRGINARNVTEKTGLPVAPVAAGVPPVYFGNAPQWVKLRITQNGFYRLTGADLSGAGVAIASVDPATIRVFSGPGMALSETTPESLVAPWGQPGSFREVARTVRDNTGQGRLDPADEIIFYGLGPDNFMSWYDAALPETWYENPHTGANVIWVTWGGSFPGPPIEIDELNAVPDPADVPVTTVWDKLHVEKNTPTNYDPVPYENGVRWEIWWWQLIDDTRPASFWDVDLPDVDTSRPGSFFVRWWGSNFSPYDPADPERKHYLNMTLNDTTFTRQWRGGVYRQDIMIDSVTVKARNRVTALVPHLGPNRLDQILLAWFEFSYWKKLSLARNTVWFMGDSTDPNPAQFRISSAADGAAAYDVTDPGRPIRLAGTVSMEGTDRVLAFRVTNPAGRRYAAVNPAGFLSPASVALDTRPSRWLREVDQPVDYLIITWDDYLPAAQTLADWRRSHLRGITENRSARVSIARVTDIYDEFSGGVVDPTAIRNFIQYVFHNWGPETPERLSYVCLIGDANRDTRDRKQTGVPNLLPTWQGGKDNISQSGRTGGLDQYSSDDFFGRLEGPDDRFTDIVIGRIPVVSESQSREVVQGKIIRSEQFPGFNPNRNRAILVADDVCQIGHGDPLGTAHIYQSENNMARVIPGTFDLRKVYLYEWGENDCSILLKPAAKRDLIRAMNEGGFLVNYIGHGSDQQLADERVMEVADVSTLNNLDELSVLIAASCSVGKFDHPDLEGLAELLVKTPSGGSLATMAATHLSEAGQNSDLIQLIIQKLFPDHDNRSVPVGKALFDAKIQQIVSSGCTGGFYCDRGKKYLLLGDPASVLVAPDRKLRFLDMPDTLRRGSTVTITGEVLSSDGQVDAGFQGTVDLLVQDQPLTKTARTVSGANVSTTYQMPGAVIFTGKTQVENGHFTATFVVPLSLRGGPLGRIRAYAADPSDDASGADTVVVGGLSSAVTDTIPPAITVSLPGHIAAPGQEIDATIEDASGVNLTQLFQFRSVQMVIEDDAGTERFRADVTTSFSYEPGSYTLGQVHTTLPELPAGHYVVRIMATDNFNNRGEGSLAIDMSGAGADAALSQLYGLPNPFRQSTQISWALNQAGSVKLGIFSVSGRKVREWSIDGTPGENRVEWDGADQRGDQVANGVYLVRVAFRPGGGGKSLDLVEPVVRVR